MSPAHRTALSDVGPTRNDGMTDAPQTSRNPTTAKHPQMSADSTGSAAGAPDGHGG
ncbi:hypothetical protein [Streptomyces chartreusis]|uniref:hypothetical protein n=1 Tax=Streptomyces chartreusis TaxID=1969 RepID=UPI0037FDF2F1